MINDFGGIDYSYNKAHAKSNVKSDVVLNYIINTEYYKNEISKANKQLNENLKRFENYIKELNANECAIFRLRYMLGIHWDLIDKYPPYYSRSQAFEIHKLALNKILKNKNKTSD